MWLCMWPCRMCDLSNELPAAVASPLVIEHWFLFAFFYHSTVTITTGLVKRKTLSLVLLSVWLICARATRLMKGLRESGYSRASPLFLQCRHLCQISLLPVYWGRSKCMFTMKECMQSCGLMVGCAHASATVYSSVSRSAAGRCADWI